MTVKVRLLDGILRFSMALDLLVNPQPESTGSIIHRVDSHSNGSGALTYNRKYK